MADTTKSRTKHSSSLLLKKEENDFIFSVLGKGRTSLATGVAQLFTADPPTRNKWTKKLTGVVCLVKDSPRRSFYIRVYDLETGNLEWEQELYNQFSYNVHREYFHTFEAEGMVAGLNFASEDEAIRFQRAIEQKVMERKERLREQKEKRREKKRQRAQQVTTGQGHATSQSGFGAGGVIQETFTNNPERAGGKFKGHYKKSDAVQIDQEDSEVQELFKHIGLENEEVDYETAEFIYGFIETHGGLDALRKETGSAPASVPVCDDAGVQKKSRSLPAPAVPNRKPIMKSNSSVSSLTQPTPTQGNHSNPPSLPRHKSMSTREAPKVAPTPMKKPFPPPKALHAAPPSEFAPPPPEFDLPPPPTVASAEPGTNATDVPFPPPPPPVNASCPPPPPPPPVSQGNKCLTSKPVSARAMLLSDINKGKSLKPAAPQQTAPVGGSNARDALMEAIRNSGSRKTLSPVARQEIKPATLGSGGGIMDSLVTALISRQNAIKDSDDDDDDEDDDEEWSD